MIWPSAYRAWGLVGGAKVHVDSGLLHSKPIQHPKRPADDAFGVDERSGAGLLPQTYNFGSSARADVAAPQASPAESRLLAHMLGIEFPPMEPSASYASGYEWWPRDQNKPRTPDSSTVSPSPKSGSSHSSPAAAMPIPFSFEQSHDFWDAPLLQDMGVNFITGV